MGTSGPGSDFNGGGNEECKITGHQEQLFFLRSVQLSIVSTPNSNSTAFEEEKHCNSITDGIRLTFDSLS